MAVTSSRATNRQVTLAAIVMPCLIVTVAFTSACSRDPETPAALTAQMAETFSFMQFDTSKYAWATVMPFSVQNTSRHPIEILEIHASEVVNVEIASFFMIGPRVPSLANAALRGWPPVSGPPNVTPEDDSENQPTMPTLEELQPVNGFVVDPKPQGKQTRIAFGKHRLYSDLPNEATIVMKYRLAKGKHVGFVRGFKVRYRFSGHRSQMLSAAESAMGLCLPYSGSLWEKCSFEAAMRESDDADLATTAPPRILPANAYHKKAANAGKVDG